MGEMNVLVKDNGKNGMSLNGGRATFAWNIAPAEEFSASEWGILLTGAPRLI